MLPDLSRLGARALPTAAGKCKDNNKGEYCRKLERDKEYHLNEIAKLRERIEELQEEIEDTLRDCEIEERTKKVAETRAQERDEDATGARETKPPTNRGQAAEPAEVAAELAPSDDDGDDDGGGDDVIAMGK